MDQLIAQIVIDEGPGRGAQIAIVVGEALEFAIDQSEHAEAPNVELSLVVEGGPLDILLHDERLLLVVVALAQDAFDFAKGRADCDTVASVRVFSRLDYPDVVWDDFFLLFVPLLFCTFTFLHWRAF